MVDTENIRDVIRSCAGLLEYTGMANFLGIESAEPRIHPTAPGELAVRIKYKSGEVVWLVAEED